MERYLDRWGPAGRTMMCSTASVQVNVEAGVREDRVGPGSPSVLRAKSAVVGQDADLEPPGRDPVHDIAARWHLLHTIGPALVAAFANSPRLAGKPTGWKSTRQGIWLDLDPARTGVPNPRTDEDPIAAWTRWSLDAPVMVVRREHAPWTAPQGLSFRTWLQLGRQAIPDRPPPTADDLDYHLTTLFPQVRPKGHLEIRYFDAQPGRWWTVPTAVVGTLLDDATAAQQAMDACAPTAGRWRDAARAGLDDAELARAATRTLHAAAASLEGTKQAWLAQDVAGYLDRWTTRGRCPADDPPAEARQEAGSDTTDHWADEPS